jgi:cytochrome subunit of sulfide dehydrogenase
VRTLSTMLVLLAVALPPGIGAADPVTARGSALANACAACHGPNGRSQGAIPAIDTLSSADFAAALQAFRANTRKGTVMNLIAKGLDDAAIEAVATYFATLRQH